jgi:hypothetical protein
MLLGVATAQGQYSPLSGRTESPIEAEIEPINAQPPVTPVRPVHLSNWITSVTPDCCGPLGGTPITSEIYFKLGPSFPVGGGFLNHTLEPGWDLQGGGRVLFFNRPVDAAWTVDVSVSNISNHGQHSDLSTPLLVEVPGPINPFTGQAGPGTLEIQRVSVISLNRTFANLALGREVYLMGSGNKDGPAWRVGADVGGRWGTARIELHEIRHRTHTATGTFLSLHSDLEVPWGCCVFQAGVRLEWDYTWMKILQEQDTNLQDWNLLFGVGIRF